MTELADSLRLLVREVVRDELRTALANRDAPAEYLSAREAGNVARVAPGTIRRWIREGRLDEHRAGRVRRVRRDDLERLLRGERRLDGLSPEALADEYVRRRYG